MTGYKRRRRESIEAERAQQVEDEGHSRHYAGDWAV